jgi:hypothetical protein
MMLDLQADLATILQARGNNPRQSRQSPLVFLNACATSPVEVNDFIDVKRTFLGLGHRGVIVTEANMPDEYASIFSRRFYHGLTANDVASSQERSVGAAMHQAKWETLKAGKNPLGLLYNLRGDPDLAFMPIAESDDSNWLAGKVR